MEVKLKAKHIIMLSKLVYKMKLDIDVKGMTASELGAAMSLGIISNLNLAETEFYDFISSISGHTVDDVRDMEIKELMLPLMIMYKEVSNFMKPAV